MTNEEHKLLARLDERTKNIEGWVQSISENMNTKYVTRQEYQPVKLLVYGFVGLVLTGVVGAILALVIRGSV